jgi:pyruvate/2-oxoglutarate dehydrogenase complex dihydrolipoamide acyltransferase (E2) component
MKEIFFPQWKGDQVLPMEPWRQVLVEGFALTPRADAVTVWLQDILATMQFRDRYRQDHNVPLTFAPLLIRTCALALRKYPQCNVMLGRRRIVIPSSIDIGVAVAGEGLPLEPVVVVRDADTKSLKEIITELREKSRGAREQQRREFQLLNRVGRWLPAPIRRRVVAWAVRNPNLRRQYVGTFQLSVNAYPGVVFDFIFPSFLVNSFMLAFQGVSNRPVVVKDKVEVRPTAYIMLAGDHSSVGRASMIGFMAEVQRLLLNPEELGA